MTNELAEEVEIELLPGEGEIKTVKSRHDRRTCDECGEPASIKHSFLLENFRSNPASSAYQHDDCTWCSDLDIFTCETCKPNKPDGYYGGSSRFPVKNFPHMFLEWVKIEDKTHGT